MAEMIEGGGSPRITVLLTNMAPRKLDPEEWPILVQTPVENATAQHLVVRVATRDAAEKTSKGLALHAALVYAHKGAGAGVEGAGVYAGESLTAKDADDLTDQVARAIFAVGGSLGLDQKLLWTLVQKLPTQLM